MTQPIQYPFINGNRADGNSIELKIAGLIFIGFKSIEYSRKRTRTKPMGAHPDPLAKTRGTNEYDANCEMYLAEFNALLAHLGAGYGDVPFTITATYIQNGFDTIQDVLRGCTIDSTTASNPVGAEALVRKFDLAPLKILYNGVDDLAVPLVGVAA